MVHKPQLLAFIYINDAFGALRTFTATNSRCANQVSAAMADGLYQYRFGFVGCPDGGQASGLACYMDFVEDCGRGVAFAVVCGLFDAVWERKGHWTLPKSAWALNGVGPLGIVATHCGRTEGI
jgi:hypothetical protein